MKEFIKNMETLKIELHFEKSEYMALTEKQKSDLKSGYLWSNKGGCWVSRCKEPNLYWAKKTAEALGFADGGKVGERLSFAEQIEKQSEKAEARAERYETYAENAVKRAETLQADLNSMRGDIAFFTQPIIIGHSGSAAFARRREKMYKRHEKGFEEYKKSEYYQDRAETARATATNEKLKNALYLDNRIKECNKNLKAMQSHIVEYEQAIYDIKQGKKARYTLEEYEKWEEDLLDRYEAEQDKLYFFEDCYNKLDKPSFSKDNIKVGYIIEIERGYGKCEVISTGTVNVIYKILDGGAKGLTGQTPYAGIKAILEATEIKKAKPKIENPYKEGDILTLNSFGSKRAYAAFQVIKATEKSVQIQEINIVDGVPQANQFKENSKPELKKIVKSRYNDSLGVCYDDRQMQKYTA